MAHLLIVADDLTGAADTGACFAAQGLATVIPLTAAAAADADVVVLSTETRDLDGAEAARIVAAAVADHLEAHHGDGPRWMYKKIDSALRGHPREELLAAMAASGETRALVAPAFPAEGRTTVGGRQFVGGLPLADSALGGASATSDLVAVFANTDLPVRVLALPAIRDASTELAAIIETEPAGILVADAATDQDLLALAHATSQTTLRLMCGTAGFARALAQSLSFRATPAPTPAIGAGGTPALVVAGSQHEATRRQVDALARIGTPVIRPSQAAMDGAEPLDAAVQEFAPSPLGGGAVAARLAQIVSAPDVARAIGGLVLTGGDVAAATLAALGSSALRLGGEIAPGQPWGVLEGGMRPELPVVTKAGSFGDDQALRACMRFLATGSGVQPER
ncbi:MAG: hypothetical protein K0S78_3353 [Thermomicrobiales bacterium]|nr:hypothetical protein [Thermomicrobiales bacterium]